MNAEFSNQNLQPSVGALLAPLFHVILFSVVPEFRLLAAVGIENKGFL